MLCSFPSTSLPRDFLSFFCSLSPPHISFTCTSFLHTHSLLKLTLCNCSILFLPLFPVVHPLVLLNCVDHYNRVAKNTKKRVVGVLLGSNKNGEVDITKYVHHTQLLHFLFPPFLFSKKRNSFPF